MPATTRTDGTAACAESTASIAANTYFAIARAIAYSISQIGTGGRTREISGQC
jgi:hypothetical protein